MHEPWQPQSEDEQADPRLDMRGGVEIVGRGAAPALKILSERFGVTLEVSPKSQSTVGERKLTVLAHNASLKDIMVQIPRALQECFWEVDRSGPAPVYVLHGDAGRGAVGVDPLTISHPIARTGRGGPDEAQEETTEDRQVGRPHGRDRERMSLKTEPGNARLKQPFSLPPTASDLLAVERAIVGGRRPRGVR